eukprot:g745.t1
MSADEINLTLDTEEGKTFRAILKRDSVFTKEIQERGISVRRGDGTDHEIVLPEARHFSGSLLESGDGVLYATFSRDEKSMRAVVRPFLNSSDVFVIDPLEKHNENGRLRHLMTNSVDSDSRMYPHVMYRMSDLGVEDDMEVYGIIQEDGTLRNRRQLSNFLPTQHNDGTYGRLRHCSWTAKDMSIGVLVDRGFSARVGGNTQDVIDELTAIVSAANVIYMDQLGVQIVIGQSVIMLDVDVSFQGPNYAPDVPGTRNSCGSDVSDGAVLNGRDFSTGQLVSVEAENGPSAMLHRFTKWAALHAPNCESCGMWHLFTDCFPSPGIVGVASLARFCNDEPFIAGYVTPNAQDVYNTGSGIYSIDGGLCEEANDLCSGQAGFSSYGPTTFRTLAHELGHNLNASHTFGLGGLMDYNTDVQFYDNLEVCSFLANFITQDPDPYDGKCLYDRTTANGNGIRERGEECDDGNAVDGDGCSSNGAIECGYSCDEPSINGESSCSTLCGNGVVDFGEECDDDSSCCDSNCEFRRMLGYGYGLGAACSPPESWACTYSCKPQPSTQKCGPNNEGYRGEQGMCIISELWCNSWSAVTFVTADFETCPLDASNPCRGIRCKHVSSGTCYSLNQMASTVVDGMSDLVRDGTPCATLSGTDGFCRSGTCVTQDTATCGNGVKDFLEECDDNSACCTVNCKLVDGATCSDPDNNECCDQNCHDRTTSTPCADESGFLRSLASVLLVRRFIFDIDLFGIDNAPAFFNSLTWIAAAIVGSLFLCLVVERAKKCLDFASTFYIIHLVLTMGYNDFSLPDSWQWWAVIVTAAIIMTTLGEQLCMRVELQDIKLDDVFSGFEPHASPKSLESSSSMWARGAPESSGASLLTTPATSMPPLNKIKRKTSDGHHSTSIEMTSVRINITAPRK